MRIDFLLGKENTLPPEARRATLHSHIYVTASSEAVIFHWGCFSIRNKENGGVHLTYLGCSSGYWSLWGEALTVALRAESIAGELHFPSPLSFYYTLYDTQYTPAPTQAYVRLLAHPHKQSDRDADMIYTRTHSPAETFPRNDSAHLPAVCGLEHRIINAAEF